MAETGVHILMSSEMNLDCFSEFHFQRVVKHKLMTM